MVDIKATDRIISWFRDIVYSDGSVVGGQRALADSYTPPALLC